MKSMTPEWGCCAALWYLLLTPQHSPHGTKVTLQSLKKGALQGAKVPPHTPFS